MIARRSILGFIPNTVASVSAPSPPLHTISTNPRSKKGPKTKNTSLCFTSRGNFRRVASRVNPLTKRKRRKADRESHTQPDIRIPTPKNGPRRENRANNRIPVIVVWVPPSPPPWVLVPAKSFQARGMAAAATKGRSPCCRPCARPPGERNVPTSKRNDFLREACLHLQECRCSERRETHPWPWMEALLLEGNVGGHTHLSAIMPPLSVNAGHRLLQYTEWL